MKRYSCITVYRNFIFYEIFHKFSVSICAGMKSDNAGNSYLSRSRRKMLQCPASLKMFQFSRQNIYWKIMYFICFLFLKNSPLFENLGLNWCIILTKCTHKRKLCGPSLTVQYTWFWINNKERNKIQLLIVGIPQGFQSKLVSLQKYH